MRRSKTTLLLVLSLLATALAGLVLAAPIGIHFIGDTEGDQLAVSGTGDSTAATDCEYVPVPAVVYACLGGGAVSGTGDATACATRGAYSAYPCAGVAASGAGDSTACNPGAYTHAYCLGAAASANGTSRGTLAAVSGNGRSESDQIAASLHGASRSGLLAASGTGASDGTVAVSGLGDATSCKTTFGYRETCSGAAVSGAGDATACEAAKGFGYYSLTCVGAALSGTGDSTACRSEDDYGSTYGGASDACLGVATTLTGDASACETRNGFAFSCTGAAVSATGNASGPLAFGGCQLSATTCTDLKVLRILVPGGATPGPDRDGDGFPATLTVEFSEMVLDTRNGHRENVPRGSSTVAIDPDDNNPDRPVVSVVEATVPAPEASQGPDADGDGFPATLALRQSRVTFDRRDPGNPRFAPGPDVLVRPDPDDANPNVPVRSVIELRGVPSGARQGPDSDGDGFPANVVLEFKDVVVDRRDPTRPDVREQPAVSFIVDRDDADPQVPVQSTFEAVVPVGAPEAGADEDRDGFPAEVRFENRRVTFDRRDPTTIHVLPTPGGVTRIDPDDRDPDAPLASIVTVLVPGGAIEQGPDADGDGFPATVTVGSSRVTFDRRDPARTTVVPGEPATLGVDPDDADPDVPARSIILVPGVPAGFVQGSDEDGDGFPATATVTTTDLAFDRRDPANPTATPAAPRTVRLDPDDQDPDTPVQSRITAVAPSGEPRPGPDRDGDGFPATLSLGATSVTYDRRDPTAVVLRPVPDVVTTVDPDDGNPNDPVQSVLRVTAPTPRVDPGADADGDGFPASATLHLQDFVFDRRDPANPRSTPAAPLILRVDPDDNNPQNPVLSTLLVRGVTTGIGSTGDADGDGVPRGLVTKRHDVAFDRRAGADAVRVTPAPDAPFVNGLDPDDHNPETPVRSTFTVPVVLTGVEPGPDADGDGFPSTVVLRFQDQVVDRRDPTNPRPGASGTTVTQRVDPNDADPNVPVPSVVLLRGVPAGVTPGPDADGDGFPASATVEVRDVAFDRRDPTNPVVTHAPARVVAVDEDDTDPQRPVPSALRLRIATGATPGPDADGDGFPADVTFTRSDVTFDRRDPRRTMVEPAGDETRVVDPDDADPQRPAPSTLRVVVPSADLAFGDDADGDRFPADVTLRQRALVFDRRNPTQPSDGGSAPDVRLRIDPDDRDPQNPVLATLGARAPAPPFDDVGPDADGDGFPAYATLHFEDVTFDRRDPTNPQRTAAPEVRVPIDENDANPNVPVQAVLVQTVPMGVEAGADEDRDGIPATVTLRVLEVTFDRRDPAATRTRELAGQTLRVDPNDREPNAVGFGEGDARGGVVAVSLRGKAESCEARLECTAVSVLGDANGYNAVSGTGNATACRLDFLCTAVSGTGTASGGDFAASATGDSDSDRIAASLLGDASGPVPLSGVGRCNDVACAAAGGGDADAYWLAASGDGSASGILAASAAGDAQGGLVAASGSGNSGGGLVAASVTGDSEGGLVAVSVLGKSRGGVVNVAAGALAPLPP